MNTFRNMAKLAKEAYQMQQLLQPLHHNSIQMEETLRATTLEASRLWEYRGATLSAAVAEASRLREQMDALGFSHLTNLNQSFSVASSIAKNFINTPSMRLATANGTAMSSLAQEVRNSLFVENYINSLPSSNKIYEGLRATAKQQELTSQINAVFGVQRGLSRVFQQMDLGRGVSNINLTNPRLNNWFPGTFAGDILEDATDALNELDQEKEPAYFIEEVGDSFSEYIVDTPFDYSTRHNVISLLLQLFGIGLSIFFSQPNYSLISRELHKGKKEAIVHCDEAINNAKRDILEAISGKMEKKAEKFHYYVVIRPVALREEPSSLSSPLCFMHAKQRVRLIHQKKNWTKIVTLDYEFGDQQVGWVRQLNIKRVPKK